MVLCVLLSASAVSNPTSQHGQRGHAVTANTFTRDVDDFPVFFLRMKRLQGRDVSRNIYYLFNVDQHGNLDDENTRCKERVQV